MTVRPIQEHDIEQVIGLFKENYGDDYSMPEFYDPNWVKRGVYSDNILWLVVEDENGKIQASGACILNFGDYNDLIGEIGRIVVDPDTAGKGLGRLILESVVDAADERVEFAFAEARTVHPKTQKINDRIGLVPLGFLPLHYKMKWRESLVLAGQLFGNARTLRRTRPEVVATVAPLAKLSLKNLELDDDITVRENVRGYLLDTTLDIQPLTATSMMRVLKIEQGRVTEPEIFSGMHLDEGMPQLATRKGTYVVALDGDRVLGALGFVYYERHQSVRIVELIAQEANVKGGLLNYAMNRAQEEYEAQVIECDVSAYSPRMQQTMLDMGFLPTSYVPAMVFHQTERYDIVKFAKLNTPWDLGPFELTESGQAYYDLVAPAFQQAAAEHESRLRALNSPALNHFTPLEQYILNHAGKAIDVASGASLDPDTVYLVVKGALKCGDRTIGQGGVIGAGIPFGDAFDTGTIASEDSQVFALSKSALDALCEAHPRLGIKLYQNLAGLR